MSSLNILICGAGIAGTSLAFWLSRQGHTVTVIERSPELRTSGLQIDLRGHGIEVLKRMGLETAFREKAVKEEGFRIVDRTGRNRAFFPANRSGKGLQSFTTDYEIMRGDLVRLLYDASKEKVKFVFGTSIEKFKQDAESVRVVYSDGCSKTFDLLVGADGQGSHTRRQILDPDVEDPIKLLNLRICYYIVPAPITDGEEHVATMYIATGSRGIMTRRHNAQEMQIYLSCDADHPQLKGVRRNDIHEEKRAFAEIFRDAGWQCKKYVDLLPDTTNFYCEHPGLVRTHTWSKGRVAILGDAAYAPTVNTGMGTTSSIVGAYILAGEIGKACDHGKGAAKEITNAFREYDRKFRPFMDQVQHGVADNKGWMEMMPTTSMGIVAMNAVMGLASFLKFDIFGRMVLKEDVKNWALPNYPQ